MNLQANMNSLLSMGAGLKKLGDIADGKKETKSLNESVKSQQEQISGLSKQLTELRASRDQIMADLAKRGSDSFNQKNDYGKYVNRLKNRRKN